MFEYINAIEELLYDLSRLLTKNGTIIFTYQPVVKYHSTQSDQTTRISSSTGSAQTPAFPGMGKVEAIESRLHTHDIYRFCMAAGLEIIENEAFVAYYDRDAGGTKVPKIYNVVKATLR